MAGGVHIVPRANVVVNPQENELVDPKPLKDIRDTPEDRELYPNDWMEKIYLTQPIYDDLLKRLKPELRQAVPWMHPNKALWVALRHLVIGDTVRPSEEDAVVEVCKSFYSVLQEEFQPVRILFDPLVLVTNSYSYHSP